MKNMMEKVILRCNFCYGKVSLLEYPTHISTCEDNSKVVPCPFCTDCKITKGELKNKDIEISHFPKIDQQLQELESKESTIIELNIEIKSLKIELENTNKEKNLKIGK